MLQKLVENIILKPSDYKKVDQPLNESNSNILVEGVQYKALSVYRFVFTVPGTENANERIYPFALWDKVVAESPVTLALMDHPEDGAGNPKDVWAVVRNPAYTEDHKYVTADAYILDNENGRSALAVLEAGGDLGLSSSGMGDFLPDGKTVNPETYILGRYFDWVLCPSYGVFGTQDDKVQPAAPVASVTESVSKKRKLTEKEEKDFSKAMSRLFNEVSAIEEPKERLEKTNIALQTYESIDTNIKKEDFELLAQKTQQEIDAGAVANTPETNLDLSALQLKLSDKDKRIAELEAELQKCRDEIADKDKIILTNNDLVASFSEDLKQRVDYASYAALQEYSKNALNLLKEKRSEIASLQAENHSLKESLDLSEKRLSALVEKSMRDEQQAIQYRKQIEEARKETARKIQEAKEQSLISRANPQVMAYYEDLIARGEDVEHMREAILSKRTLYEAQMYFLKNKQRQVEGSINLGTNSLSEPILYGRGTQVNKAITLPKGFI